MPWLRPALRQSWTWCTTASILMPRSLMAKCRSQLCYTKAWRTNKKTWNFFAPPPGGVHIQSPTKLGMVTEEVHTILTPLKHVRLRRILSASRCAKNLGVTRTALNLNPDNSETPWTIFPNFNAWRNIKLRPNDENLVKITQWICSWGRLYAEILVTLSVLWAYTPTPAPIGVKFRSISPGKISLQSVQGAPPWDEKP